MDMVAEIAIPSNPQGHLRRIDMRRDLAQVADLVELCFYDTLDPDGRQYLNEMRRAAQNASLLRWASGMIEESPMPPSGFVWEEDGRLVGNLSLIPIRVQGSRGYMIANVATHPDFRGRGIARALTSAALDYARRRNASCAWLQVRDDNPSAIHIYETCGFTERLRRTSWYGGPDLQEHRLTSEVKVEKRSLGHWSQQKDWLKRLYPPEMDWHIHWDWNLFNPGFWGSLYRFFNMEFPHHWCVERQGVLQGVLTWNHGHEATDPLWLAVPEAVDEEAIQALLVKARRKIGLSRPLSLNFPADLATGALHQAGFVPHQTLIWMSIDLVHGHSS